jgi:hypothetical protein
MLIKFVLHENHFGLQLDNDIFLLNHYLGHFVLQVSHYSLFLLYFNAFAFVLSLLSL